MDPVILAIVTSATVALASEAGKGVASEAGKDVWGKIKSLFKWSTEPAQADLAAAVAKALESNEALARQVVEVLKAKPTGTASTLVDSIKVEKGSLTIVQTNVGDITNTNTFN